VPSGSSLSTMYFARSRAMCSDAFMDRTERASVVIWENFMAGTPREYSAKAAKGRQLQLLEWTIPRMLDQLDDYNGGRIDLGHLINNLRGLLGAADIHDSDTIEAFGWRLAAIDSEHELRTEPWAPPGAATEKALAAALDDFRTWATSLLNKSDNERL
jgi:hypothetical protein